MFVVRNEIGSDLQDVSGLDIAIVANDLQRFVANGERVWARQLECEVNKVIVATTVNNHTDERGAHCDYYVGDQLIFSEFHNNGNRIRISYDLVGRQEGRCTDYTDGRRVCNFDDGDQSYCIRRDRFGVSICRADGFGNWVNVSNLERRAEITAMETMIFTPPHDLCRVA